MKVSFPLLENIKMRLMLIVGWLIIFALIILINCQYNTINSKILYGLAILNLVIVLYVTYYSYSKYNEITNMSSKDLLLKGTHLLAETLK
jgi:glucan phosphoethanolaminetransferase (alkaline phosphatase superfamily)